MNAPRVRFEPHWQPTEIDEPTPGWVVTVVNDGRPVHRFFRGRMSDRRAQRYAGRVARRTCAACGHHGDTAVVPALRARLCATCDHAFHAWHAVRPHVLAIDWPGWAHHIGPHPHRRSAA
ncbi:hypothetical protein [Cellulomonas rhizosphaerae]|uniref:Uncharacterized protein n=1 Tax=Cellulomonas rhizosphaerae TaxID=2293719 RepID=A0A413RJH7_9CELL|nr:hypothetical protein [Cellulomonas rhizosphaerae]RHA38686.1 hypothetical protein D1825_13205 [Cellulomonas rhizosphaerae]